MAADIADEQFVRVSTYRKNGDAVAVPVWIADLGDGTLGFTTESSSYKVKRLANNPKLTLQPCNFRGEAKAGSEEVSGTGRVVTGAEFERVRAAIKSKYGVQFAVAILVGRVGRVLGRRGGTDTAVIVTLD